MHRAVTVAAVAMMATAACSSAGDEAGGSTVGAVADPVITFCDDWDRFDRLTNSDDDPTEALVHEVVELQDEMGGVIPEGVESDWETILDWTGTFIDYFQTTGYQQPSEATILDLLGGEEAAQVASEEAEGAYEAIRSWSRQHCPASGGTTFCGLWPTYDEFVESVEEPTEELVAQLLEMQSDIDVVLPAELTTAWADIVDWNQAFIDVFERVGYGPVTEETFEQAFGGHEDAAGAAADAMEAGFTRIRSWAASNCTDGSEHALTFCENWDEFAFLTADEDAMTPESYGDAIAVIDRVGDDVPVEIRSDWNAVVGSARGFHDVLVSVNFEPDRITDDLLEQAFGSVGAAEATEEAADAGHAAIEEWALRGCGDFCSRWPELRRALVETGTDEPGWIHDMGDGAGHARLAEHLRAFDLGDRLVPDEIGEPWELAVAARRDWIAWWEAFEFRGDRLDSPEARQQGLETLREATYLTEEHEFMDATQTPIGPDRRRVISAWQDGVDRAPAWLWTAGELAEDEKHEIAAWLEGTGKAPGWIVEMLRWPPGERFGGQPVATLDEWVGGHCEVITGRPGTVKV